MRLTGKRPRPLSSQPENAWRSAAGAEESGTRGRQRYHYREGINSRNRMRNNPFASMRIMAIIGLALALLIFFGIITYSVTIGRGALALPGGGSFLSVSTPTPTPVPCTKSHHPGGDRSLAIVS